MPTNAVNPSTAPQANQLALAGRSSQTRAVSLFPRERGSGLLVTMSRNRLASLQGHPAYRKSSADAFTAFDETGRDPGSLRSVTAP